MRMTVKRAGWLQDPTSVAPGARAPEEPGVRQRKEKALERFLRTPYADDVVHVLQHYVRGCIPRYRATEREYWSLSCMPGTFRGRLAAVSLRSMETFVVQSIGVPAEESETGEPSDVLAGFVIVSRSALQEGFGAGLGRLEAEHPGLIVEPSRYRDAGDDQVRLLGELVDVHDALVDDAVAYAARALSTRLVDGGRTMQKHGHCYQLADLVVGDAAPSCAH